MIQAIETHYKGYRFRSRLEARWAVFFDALGFDWQYELQGFNLGDVGLYLPDFMVFTSIGPTVIEIKPVVQNDVELGKSMDRMVECVEIETVSTGVPRIHGFLLHGTPGDSVCPGMFFTRDTANHIKVTPTMAFGECPFCRDSCLIGMGEERCRIYCMCVLQQSVRVDVKRVIADRCTKSETMMKCYEAARSARFEHGETPRVQRGRQSTKKS